MTILLRSRPEIVVLGTLFDKMQDGRDLISENELYAKAGLQKTVLQAAIETLELAELATKSEAGFVALTVFGTSVAEALKAHWEKENV